MTNESTMIYATSCYGCEPNETDLANHNDEWYEHTDSPTRRGQCRTCAHNGCCVDLPYCGGLRWESAYDEDEEETEEEEEKEINND